MANDAYTIQLRELKDLVSTLNATIASLNVALKAAEEREKSHLEREKVLREQIDYLTKKLFGRSSEKSTGIPGQMSFFDEAETEADTSQPEPELTVVKEHTRKAKATHKELFKGIKAEEIEIPLPEDEQICPECGTKLEVIGREFARRELEYIPATLKVKEYYTLTYGCPECKKGDVSDNAVIVKSKAPEPLMPHSYTSASCVAWTMYQKYANSIPLYRQEKDWAQYGATLNRTTLANWIIYCANEYFLPIYEYFHRQLVKRNFLMADETRVQVLKEPGRNAETESFMWLYRSGEDGLPEIILYGYSPTRAGYNASEFLKGFEGYLETDGYQGYNKVIGVKHCSCWAHARRYLVDAVPKGKELDYRQPAVQGIQYCNKLFDIEEKINSKNLSHERRKEERLKKEKPIIDAFFAWLDEQHPITGSRMYKAKVYLKNHQETLQTYLEDGRCSFSNNLSENAIRPFTVGRKNWLFSDSVKGVVASSVVYTIVEMAKAHELNIYNYLKFLLESRPQMTMSDDQLEKMAPWNPNVKEMLQ